MNLSKSLSWKTVVAIALLAAAIPTFAQKRRAVAHPGPAVPPTAITVNGTVLDQVTGAPVVYAEVRFMNRTYPTDRAGKFKINSTIYGTATITASRTGYVAASQNITGGGEQQITLRLQPTPTVSLRTTAGATYAIDFESVEFGYVPAFGSYHKAESEDFCKSGTQVVINRGDFRKITGPAVLENNSSCCTERGVLKITAQLKSGETSTLYFLDSCAGYMVDFIGRDHVTGEKVFTKFSNVAEIVFP